MKAIAFASALLIAGQAWAADITVMKPGAMAGDLVPAASFTGTARVERLLFSETPAPLSGGVVSFEAKARTHWHTHPLGQTLIVISGLGRVQQWGGPILEIRQGDVVRIPPNTKHWHGAGPNTAMQHVALAQSKDGRAVQWMELVDDSQYDPQPAMPQVTEAQPVRSRAQQLVGDVAPKLAELTDEVLFGDIWARPQLGRRDRSLVTVSALIAMNRPEQLRSHLALAKQNGLTEAELSEVITHLAFYAGWPSAMTAAGVAKETFQKQ